jgi:hypothetical protein
MTTQHSIKNAHDLCCVSVQPARLQHKDRIPGFCTFCLSELRGPHSFSADWIPTGIDEYNKKIMLASIKDPDLFRVKNKFAHDRYTKRLGSNPLVKRCGTNLALRVSCSTYHDE